MIIQENLSGLPLTAWLELADDLVEKRQWDLALAHCEKALDAYPADARAIFRRGWVLFKMGRIEEGILDLRRAVSIDESDGEARYRFCKALWDSGKVAEAAGEVRRAETIAAGHAGFQNLAATIAIAFGDFHDAKVALMRAIQLDPSSPFAVARMFEIAPGDVEAELRDTMTELAADKNRSPMARASAFFALACFHEREGDIAGAVRRYLEGNQCYHEEFEAGGRAYNSRTAAERVDRLIALLDVDTVMRLAGGGNGSPRPAFVCGMPRSGTTLVEQIVSSHPKVAGLDELDHFNRYLGTLLRSDATRPIDVKTLNVFGEEYLSYISAGAVALGKPYAERITNKLPDGALMIGLIVAMFPHSRILVVERDPRDVVLSCFIHPFRNLAWAADIENIVHQWRLYDRAISHWRSTIPESFREVRYEELVRRPEKISRDMIGFLGVEWSEACMRFGENDRPVRTVSQIQVRGAISEQAVGRWRRYYDYMPDSYRRFVDDLTAAPP